MGMGQGYYQFEDGSSIELPPYSGLTGGKLKLSQPPDVYAIGTKQICPIGTFFRQGIRTFVYAKYSATTSLKSAGYAMVTVATLKDLSSKVISGNINESTITINFDGTACAVNAYAGGFLGIKGSHYSSRYIISNKVKDSDNYVEFTVDGTWPNNLLTTDNVTLMENPYAEVRWYITADTRPYVGVSMITNVASNYAWLQTWGPHMMCAVHNTFVGDTGREHGFVIINGSFQGFEDPTSSVVAPDTAVYGALRPCGFMAAGSDPGTPAQHSIAPPIWLTFHR